MSVMPHEGTHVILYGGTNIPAGTQVHSGYLARPDLGGGFPTIVVVPDKDGVDSSVKDLCRRFARHGFAAITVDLYRDHGPGRRATPAEMEAAAAAVPRARALADLDDLYGFIASPGTPWAAPDRVGVFGIGWGGSLALESARSAREMVRAATIAYAPADGPPPLVDLVAGLRMPLLCLYGRESETDIDAIKALRDANSRTEIVVYNDVGDGFLDDGSDAFDPTAGNDAVDRAVEFFGTRLSPRQARAV